MLLGIYMFHIGFLGDQNPHIILNGTNIANPDNTLPDSININIKEDCIKLPNSVHLYCP